MSEWRVQGKARTSHLRQLFHVIYDFLCGTDSRGGSEGNKFILKTIISSPTQPLPPRADSQVNLITAREAGKIFPVTFAAGDFNNFNFPLSWPSSHRDDVGEGFAGAICINFASPWTNRLIKVALRANIQIKHAN
jgi:hypothetical protein